MATNTFIMTNVKNDEDLLINFVESILDAEVKSLEFSFNCDTTVLVTLKENLPLEDINSPLQEEQSDIVYDDNRPLQIIDPGYDADAILVNNVDENFLSHEFLRLYIESTFADGNDVINNCKAAGYGENAVVVSFNQSDVISRVLEEEDHVPLRSHQEFHIQCKPFYRTFYTDQWERVSENDADSIHNDDSFMKDYSVVNNDMSDSIMFTEEDKEYNSRIFSINDDIDPDIKDKEEEKEKEEEDTMKIPRHTWELLKEKIHDVTKCQIIFKEDEETLYMRGTGVTNSQSEILTLLQGVKRSSIYIPEDMKAYVENQVVKKRMKDFFDRLKSTSFAISDDSLNISTENEDDVEEKVRAIFFHSKSIQSKNRLDYDQIRELSAHCKMRDMLAVWSYDEVKNQMTLKGMREDVEMLFSEISEKIKDMEKIEATFKWSGRQAEFINKFKIGELEKILEKTDILKEVKQNTDVLFDYRIQRNYKKDIDKALDTFRKSITETTIDLKEFGPEELALINQNLKTDVDFLKRFEDSNRCCIFVEGIEDSNFTGARAKSGRENTPIVSSQAKAPKTTMPTLKQKEMFTVCSACQLQICQNVDITKETSELLVCVVDQSLNLNKTMVSKAFSKLDSSLRDQIKSFKFSQNGVFIDQRSIPNASCKAVAFITFKVWQKGASDPRLTAAVTEVLDQANKMGLSTISIPPLGFGKAFQYPANETAHAVVHAIHSFIKANSKGLTIKQINLMAPERRLFNEIVKVADSIQMLARSNDDNDDDDSNDDDSNDDDDTIGGEKEIEMELVTPTKQLCIFIISAGMGQLESKFKDEIKKMWLYIEKFEPGHKFCWSPQFMNDIIKAASVRGVWVCKTKDTSSKHWVCQIKGKRDEVMGLKAEMYRMVMELNKDAPKKILFSPSAPKRGTLEFVNYAANCEAHFPSYWNMKWADYLSDDKKLPQFQLVDVDSTTFKIIENIVTKTWNPSKTGAGFDASGIPPNSQVSVKKIQRVENPSLYVKYAVRRGFICKEIHQRNKLCVDVEKLTNSRGPAETMMLLGKPLQKELLTEVNEYFLLHGTKEKIVSAICSQGMDCRLASAGAMFGRGVYTAECSTKADQYSDERDNRLPNGTNLTMFLTRVTMGDVFLCDHNHHSVTSRDSEKLKRPPCMNCAKDVCDCGAQFYHSVMGDGKWIFREFVVYEKDQCYPEYMITYQRV